MSNQNETFLDVVDSMKSTNPNTVYLDASTGEFNVATPNKPLPRTAIPTTTIQKKGMSGETTVYVDSSSIKPLAEGLDAFTNGGLLQSGHKDENVYHAYGTQRTNTKEELLIVKVDDVENIPSAIKNKAYESLKLFILFIAYLSGKLAVVCQQRSNRGYNEVKVNFIPAKEELYSRNEGILESNVLSTKHVFITGIGSFGSNIGVELAKSGVGKITLLDFDKLELSNVSRHVCGVEDLGRFKTLAVKDKILSHNPYCEVFTYEKSINDDPNLIESIVKDSDVVVNAADENSARELISFYSQKHAKPNIFGRAMTRACGGDIFISRPYNNDPCYACLIGNQLKEFQNPVFSHEDQEVSSFKQARRQTAPYILDEDVKKYVDIQPGLSVDIIPFWQMMTRLALIELSKNNSTSPLIDLEEDLKGSYYFYGNRRIHQYSFLKPLSFDSKGVTSMRWYTARIEKNPDCFACSIIKQV